MAERVHYTGPAPVRWGPVLAGAVIGLAVMVLLNTFWVALAEGSGIDAVGANMHWYTFVSAIVALLVAGLFAGWLSGVPGPGTGLLNGLTVWGLVLAALVVFPIPEGLRLFEVFTAPLPDLGTGAVWASFFALLIGLVAAALGGLIGGGLATTTAATEPAAEPTATVPPQRTDAQESAPAGSAGTPNQTGAGQPGTTQPTASHESEAGRQ